MRTTLGMALILAIFSAPFQARAESLKLKKHDPSPRGMVCNKGRACGDSHAVKKLA